jgi:hypothetical protein
VRLPQPLTNFNMYIICTPSGFVYKACIEFKISFDHQFLPIKNNIYIIKFILLDSYSKEASNGIIFMVYNL